jgi:hypothetical protein
MERDDRQTLTTAMMELLMAQDNQKTSNEKSKKTPDLEDVEPGSDADATPVPDIGKTPPDPNKPSDQNGGVK